MLGKGYVIKGLAGDTSATCPRAVWAWMSKTDFEPKYVVSRDKSKTVKELKAEVKDASTVYLATDPDREGEAIAWHLAEATRADHTIFRRVVFP